MSLDALITLGVLLVFLGVIIRGRLAVDFALAGAMVALLVFGVLTPNEAFSGFSNPALFIIACLYVVASALKESGALHWWVMRLLGNSGSIKGAIPRIMGPVALSSSMISNTPVVAIFIPLIQDWARRHKLSVSKLLIPLSYASILGGTCTLIGTSTNILVVGMLQSTPEANSLSLFSPALIGIPLVILGIVYFGDWPSLASGSGRCRGKHAGYSRICGEHACGRGRAPGGYVDCRGRVTPFAV